MVRQVPTDIIEVVVDHLYDDKPTLAACTLVSRAWLRRSRFRLFKSVTYRAPSDGSGFTPFLDFLRSSPALASLIRELILDGTIPVDIPSSTDNQEPQDRDKDHEIISHSSLIDILDSLPALYDLELRHVWFTRPHTWTNDELRRFEAGPVREISLRKLVLRCIGHFDSVRSPPKATFLELRSLLSIFSSTQELRVDRLSRSFPLFDSSSSHLNLKNPLFGQSQSFSLVAPDPFYPDEFWDTLYQISSPVRSLSIRSTSLRRIARFVGATTNLKHLGINCNNAATFNREPFLVLKRLQLTLSPCSRGRLGQGPCCA